MTSDFVPTRYESAGLRPECWSAPRGVVTGGVGRRQIDRGDVLFEWGDGSDASWYLAKFRGKIRKSVLGARSATSGLAQKSHYIQRGAAADVTSLVLGLMGYCVFPPSH